MVSCPPALNHLDETSSTESLTSAASRMISIARSSFVTVSAFLRCEGLKDQTDLHAPFGFFAMFFLEFLDVLCCAGGS